MTASDSLSFRIEPEMASLIDKARGDQSRSGWARSLIIRELKQHEAVARFNFTPHSAAIALAVEQITFVGGRIAEAKKDVDYASMLIDTIRGKAQADLQGRNHSEGIPGTAGYTTIQFEWSKELSLVTIMLRMPMSRVLRCYVNWALSRIDH